MKKLHLILIFWGFIYSLHAQIVEEEVYYPQPLEDEPCYYSSYSLNTKGEIENLQTEPVMMEAWTTPIRGRIIDFTMLKVELDLLLMVEIHKDAEEVLQPQCFGRATTIEFDLRNGMQVTLPYFGTKQCGYINTADDEAPYYNITNIAYFLISEENAEKLLSSELNLASLKSTNYELNFVVESELYDEVNDMLFYPELYFISELECMLYPKLPKE